MKRTQTDDLLEALGFGLIVFYRSPHIVEYVNANTGMEIKFNLLSKKVSLKKHLLGHDEAFECDKMLLDLISQKMLELTQGGR